MQLLKLIGNMFCINENSCKRLCCHRVNLAESLPIILKKEYGCHRRDILRTEQCLARQLESSMSSGQIIGELNDLENSNSFSKR